MEFGVKGRSVKKTWTEGSLHSALMDELSLIPQRFFTELLRDKLAQQDIEVPDDILSDMARHFISGAPDPFSWDADEADGRPPVDLAFTSEEVREIERRAKTFMKEDAPDIIGNLIHSSAKLILRTLDKDWPNQQAHEMMVATSLSRNIEERWGKGLNELRKLLVIAREIAGEVHTKNRRSRSRKRIKLDALLRLHARACQVVAEIIVLLENGFSDGAMARWRTLHELAVVAALLADHDPELTERYLAHEAVEAKRALDNYAVCYERLGYRPSSKRDIKAVERAYRSVLELYGNAFGSQYGWAAKHVGIKKPTFSDLERAAGQGGLRAHYQMAGYNVHASAKGIAFRLGLLEQRNMIIAGPTNAGLTEPGQNAAIALVQVTGMLMAPVRKFDDLIMLKILIDLRDRVPKALARSDRRLKRDCANQG